jgi:hypothetical protein
MKLNRITALLMLSSLPLLANAASYTVVELPTKDLSINQFGSAIDDTGLVVATVSQAFNPPIDLSLIELSNFTLNDPDGAAVGDFDVDDYNTLGAYIYTQSDANSFFGQKLASQIAFKTDGTETEYINGLDHITEGTNGFTFGQQTIIGDSVNGTHIVGSMAGPFNEIEYTDTSGNELVYTVNDFASHGFIQVDDNVTELAPEDTTSGGLSSANAINANLQVAGSVSVGLIDNLSEAAEACLDDDQRLDEPVEACLYRVRLPQNGSDSFKIFSHRRATIWQADANGNVISQVKYGLLFEPTGEETAGLSSEALDINDSGVAVGSSSVPRGTSFSTAATIFEDGLITRIIDDEDMLPNIATTINNNGFVAGYQTVVVGQVLRTKMFIYNKNTADLNFSNGFFINSSTIPRAMNDNNLVVGEGESEASQSTRRRSGFVYDINTDTFTNLNTLVPCDTDMDIIAANGINNSGEIIADALIKRAARNLNGEVILDSNGEETLVDRVVAVKLVPTGDIPSNCSSSEEDESTDERQGAGIGFLTLLGLLMTSVFRRRFKKA